MPEIRPGMNLDIMVATDPPDVRKVTIYDMSGNTLVLSQTTPPLRPSFVGRIFDCSFVAVGSNGRKMRWCFPGRIQAFRPDYPINESRRVPAMTFVRAGGFQKGELRQFYRISTKCKEAPLFFIGGRHVPLLDISLCGACFSQSRLYAITAGDRLKADLIIQPHVFPLEVRVVRVVVSREHPELHQVSVEFVAGRTAEMEQVLGKRIFFLEREYLCRL